MTIIPEQQIASLVFVPSSNQKNGIETNQKWESLCPKIGESLLQSHQGFLASFRCLAVDATPNEELPWHIELREHSDFFDISIGFRNSGSYEKVRDITFRLKGSTLDGLSQPLVPETIGRMILESLPIGWLYTHDASAPKITFKTNSALPAMPNEMLIYELTFQTDTKLWVPLVRARLIRVGEPEIKEGVRTEEYQLSADYIPLKDGTKYWVQNTAGLDKRRTEYENVLKQRIPGFSPLNLLDHFLFESLSSNYAGFRYGRALTQGDSVINDTSVLSILAEIRGGPLAGLRGYYDIFPVSTRGTGAGKESFSLKRASVGWSFSYPLPEILQPFASQVDFQPKLGLLDLDAHTSPPASTGQSSASFTAKNIYDLALEVGIERQTPLARARLWSSYNAAMFGASNKTAVSVLSGRAGIDAYFDLFKWGESLEVNFLVFAFGEQLRLAKNSQKIAEQEEIGVSAVAVKLFFGGVGFTVSW